MRARAADGPTPDQTAHSLDNHSRQVYSARLRRLFKRRDVWAIALYRLRDESEFFHLDQNEPFRIFGETGFRWTRGYQSTTADPFLFAYNNRLYLFFEVQTDFGVGGIWARSMDVDGKWTEHGQVLKEDFHLSFPHVFLDGGQIWMIPEAASSGKVWLYAAEEFPTKWRRSRVVVDEPLLDPAIIMTDDGVFLFATTEAYELKLFHARTLGDEFIDIGMVITRDKKVARNAGVPVHVQGKLYRLAQDCSIEYGKAVSLNRIEELSPKTYRETMVVPRLFGRSPSWMAVGYHHVSIASFEGESFVAVDGKRRDIYANTILLALQKALG